MHCTLETISVTLKILLCINTCKNRKVLWFLSKKLLRCSVGRYDELLVLLGKLSSHSTEFQTLSLYCFIFPQHPTFSSTKMSSFTLLPFKERFVSQQKIGTCNHQEHYTLEWFFHSTVSILDLYTQHLLHDTANKLQSLIEDERSKVFDSATNHHEADWTKRLHYAVTRDFAWMNAQLTMNRVHHSNILTLVWQTNGVHVAVAVTSTSFMGHQTSLCMFQRRRSQWITWSRSPHLSIWQSCWNSTSEESHGFG